MNIKTVHEDVVVRGSRGNVMQMMVLPVPAGRLTLVRVFLWFICLLALTPQPAAKPKPCTKDIIKNVKNLITKTSNLWLDCRLYTPTINDYKQKCPVSTIKCFADEVKVLIEESGSVLHSFKLNIQLEKLASFLNQTTNECLQCELFREEKAEKFLNDLLLILEAMNFQHC